MRLKDPEYQKALTKAREVVDRYAHIPQGGPTWDGTTPPPHVLTFALGSGVLAVDDIRTALGWGQALTDPSRGWPFRFGKARLAEALGKAQSDPWYFDGLGFVASLCLSRGGTLPAPLMAFACGVLDGRICRPKQTKRWTVEESPSFWRWVAAEAVHEVMLAAAVTVTTNRASVGGGTAAAAVASAMSEAARTPNTEAAVAAAWNDKATIGSMLFLWMGQIRTK
jgi:hypothetical protein